MSRAVHTLALLEPPILAGSARRLAWSGLEPALARALTAIGDCARIAWWDGSAVGLHLNGLLGLFEADAPPRRRGRA